MSNMTLQPRAEVGDRTAFLLSKRLRLFLVAAAAVLTLLSCYGVVRWLLGYSVLQPRSIAVVIHIATVLPAIPLGAYLLLSMKGDYRHRMLGYVWLALMMVTAISTIFIRFNGSFSLIHIFTVLAFIAVPGAITSARSRNIVKHRKHMIQFYIGALIIAGITAFAPGRTMWHWAFG
ncbi:MAG: DUF2306 domain-containing protein [Allosphingosinicella sp.]|uniref:DUF2306 domain-containing protein n=1 Tax=Allosphingosinicella sp. TaxID=2823234 RepID=UPI0039560EB4